MATFRNKSERLALIWALDVMITGRGDAVKNARRVLLWIAAGAQEVNTGALQSSYIQIKELVSALKMPRQTVYRSLNRLLDQKLLVERNSWYAGSKSFRLAYKAPEAGTQSIYQ